MLYPCDAEPHYCPFSAELDSSGQACRNHCGLGVDEDEPESEDDLEDGYVDESMNPYDGTYDYENDIERF